MSEAIMVKMIDNKESYRYYDLNDGFCVKVTIQAVYNYLRYVPE